ncbi:MAG: ABC transporter substrate-binding protein [Betaproteobacteria bacterium]|nr:ABC transporter substrate-binding protein [Betaproteobacteria bacterium]
MLTPHRLDPAYPIYFEALRDLRYHEGKNLRLLVRSAEMKHDRLPALAKDLAEARPDVIVAINTPGARAAIQATRDMPIVLTIVGDPVGSGFVPNLARPGGDATGVSNMTGALAAKRMSLLKELVPGAKRIAVLYNPVDPVTAPQIRDAEGAAPRLGVEIRQLIVQAHGDVRGPDPERGEAGQPPGGAAHQVPSGAEPEDRWRNGPHRPPVGGGASDRDHRVMPKPPFAFPPFFPQSILVRADRVLEQALLC